MDGNSIKALNALNAHHPDRPGERSCFREPCLPVDIVLKSRGCARGLGWWLSTEVCQVCTVRLTFSRARVVHPSNTIVCGHFMLTTMGVTPGYVLDVHPKKVLRQYEMGDSACPVTPGLPRPAGATGGKL